MLATVKEGMTEKELSVQMQCLMLKYGAEKNSFDPIVSFGENTSKPHAHPTDRKLKKGDNVLLDFGCVVGGYCSDMTRTFFFGEPDEKINTMFSKTLHMRWDTAWVSISMKHRHFIRLTTTFCERE